MPEIELSKPIEQNGEEKSTINLDLDGLTGNDLTQAEAEHSVTTGGLSGVPELSKSYLAHVAARAASLPVDDIKQLSAKDFSRVTMEVQNFLLG